MELISEVYVKDIKSFPLKERKRARIRLALAEALLEQTQTSSFEKIKIELLCQEAEISRATFFRLFPRKIDLIFYVINIWIIEIGWQLEQNFYSDSGYQKIKKFYQLTAESYEKHPNFFIEAIGQRALNTVEFNSQDNESNQVAIVERLIRFPDYEGIENIPEGGFLVLLREYIKLSQKHNELPESLDVEKAVLSLACLFYGVPIMVSDRSSDNLTKSYSDQLSTIWNGLGGKKE